MTIASTRTREFNVNEIVRLAWQFAGLLEIGQGPGSPQWSQKFELGRDTLDLILKDSQTSIIVRNTVFLDITLVEGTATYALGETYFDVIGDGSLLLTGDTAATSVTPFDMQSYNALSDKTVSGRPNKYYLHRIATPTLYLWPVPDAAGTLTVQAQQLIADVGTDGDNTLDIERYWTKWLVLELAHYLALSSSLPLNRVTYLQQQAEVARANAEAKSKPAESSFIHVDHSTQWTR